jgi:hypothetical protein
MTLTPQAQAFGAVLDAALARRHAIRLPTYHRPAPIVYTPEQTEAEIRAANRFWDES